MGMTAQQMMTDPLGTFVVGAIDIASKKQIPLVSSAFEVDITSGLASVRTARVFRNTESESIEATITFPMPIHAVLFELCATVDGRILTARAQCREAARETYEGAIERGKTTVLHEEVLRGVHMLSVAHIPPGAEIKVEACWAATLSQVEETGRIRIPLTVGDIYGRSGMLGSDDLIHGGPVQQADLTVRCDSGRVDLRFGELIDGHARVPLNVPIDLKVTNTVVKDLHGLAADGRDVVLRVEPLPTSQVPLDVAILIDHSGSMGSPCDGHRRKKSKHQAIVEGLRTLAEQLNVTDAVDLWEFDTSLSHIGATHGKRGWSVIGKRRANRQRLAGLIGRLSGPAGGTEIGHALERAIAFTPARDILLVTDGKSHAIDIQNLANQGHRISVVLVGEDSLEANVGHLAALTGGDILIATGNDIALTLMTALDGLRSPFEGHACSSGLLQALSTVRGGAKITAAWYNPTGVVVDPCAGRAVAAMAAGLALPTLNIDDAGRLAEAEGLVTHLTSLILVDEASEVQDGIPATRKTPLPRPAALISNLSASFENGHDVVACSRRSSKHDDSRAQLPDSEEARHPGFYEMESYKIHRRHQEAGCTSGVALNHIFVDWEVDPNRLLAGDFTSLDPHAVAIIRDAASHPNVLAVARQLGIDPALLILALVARKDAISNRSAARIARLAIGAFDQSEIATLAKMFDLKD